VFVVQEFKAELGGAHHKRKPAQAVPLDADFHHLTWFVVDRIQNQGAYALVISAAPNAA